MVRFTMNIIDHDWQSLHSTLQTSTFTSSSRPTKDRMAFRAFATQQPQTHLQRSRGIQQLRQIQRKRCFKARDWTTSTGSLSTEVHAHPWWTIQYNSSTRRCVPNVAGCQSVFACFCFRNSQFQRADRMGLILNDCADFGIQESLPIEINITWWRQSCRNISQWGKMDPRCIQDLLKENVSDGWT